jgi:diphthamide synthase subunit DPH2
VACPLLPVIKEGQWYKTVERPILTVSESELPFQKKKGLLA